MKKLFAILLAAILCLGLLAGCGQTTIIVNMGGEDDTPDATPTPEVVPTDPPADTPAPVVEDVYKRQRPRPGSAELDSRARVP